MRSSLSIAVKDLRAELRTKQVLNSMLIFTLVVMVILSLSLSDVLSESSVIERLAPGLIWIAFVFAGTVGISRAYVSEIENGCLEALRLCPVDCAAIYTGKVISGMCLMLIVEIAAIPVFIVFFNYNIPHLPEIFLIILLGTAGFSAVGTLLAALSVNTRTREIMLPVLLIPLLLPVLIPTIIATAKILAGDGIFQIISELRLIVLYDIVFFTLARLLFEHTLEG
ncbi:MAG: heme exporter protein CcmB [Methanomethylovorans sp.]|nr:heme exporter protein CcmB [Methanomethylovorans sp.]